MITQHYQKGDAHSEAVYSDCFKYRYILTRVWHAAGPKALFVMLNPSTATEVQNDPTVERCERRSRVLGFGAFKVVNIFAFRATDPKVMRAQADPVGVENDIILFASAMWADHIVCAWGSHGAHLGRGAGVTTLLRDTGKALHHFGLTKTGLPKHPLYVGYQVLPQIWS